MEYYSNNFILAIFLRFSNHFIGTTPWCHFEKFLSTILSQSFHSSNFVKAILFRQFYTSIDRNDILTIPELMSFKRPKTMAIFIKSIEIAYPIFRTTTNKTRWIILITKIAYAYLIPWELARICMLKFYLILCLIQNDTNKRNERSCNIS